MIGRTGSAGAGVEVDVEVEVEADLRCARSFLDVAFPQDDSGRILRSSAEAPRPEPGALFVLVRTRLANLWRLALQLPPPVLAGLARLAGREAALDRNLDCNPDPAASAPPERLEPMRRLLAAEHEEVEVVRLLLYRGVSGPDSCFDSSFESGSALDVAQESIPTRGSDARWPARVEIEDGGVVLVLKWEDRGRRQTLESKGVSPFADVTLFE